MKIDKTNLNTHILNNNSNAKNSNINNKLIENIYQEDSKILINLHKIKNSITESNGIDNDKVFFYKEKIKNYNYEIDFKKLAQNIIREDLD